MSDGNAENVEIPPLQETGCHDHISLVYKGDSELIPAVVGFIQKGVKSGERCIYLNAGEELLDRVLKNAIAAQKNGVKVLVSLGKEESWLKEGGFEPDRVLQLLRELTLAGTKEGYKGIRFICDMGWAGERGVAPEQVLKFEAALNGFAAENDVALLCLYNRSVIGPELLLETTKLHPLLGLGGKSCPNLLHVPPDQYLCPTRRLSELDILFSALQSAADTVQEQKKLRQELDQAYGALARKIYETWQEEDTLRASEKQLHEQDDVLKEHRRRLLTLLQHLPVLLAAFDQNRRLVSCNHEFERVTGFRAEEVVGKRMLELFDPELQEEMASCHPADGGDYRGREWSIRCKDGSLKSISWSCISRYVPIAGWSNWVMGIDLTQKVQAEDRLRTLTSELSRHAGELEQFSYLVSQDLSGQLAKVSSHCRELQEKCGRELPSFCRDMLQQIHEAALEMVEKMATLLRFTILSTGQIATQEVDLSAMVSEIAARLRVRGGERAVTFTIEEGVVVRGDERLLRLAMEQLLENAWISARQEEHPLIRFGAVQVEGERRLFVSDNGLHGCGIDTRPGNGERGGIGLATVERIINLHRGRLWPADEAGNGSTLYFTV